MIVKGHIFEGKKERLLTEVNKFFKTYFKIENKIIAAKSISRGVEKQMTLITVDNFETKDVILKNKKEVLKDKNIFIELDLSPYDQKIGYEVRSKARLERVHGNTVIVKNSKLKINEEWFYWDEVAEKWEIETEDLNKRGERKQKIKKRTKPTKKSDNQGESAAIQTQLTVPILQVNEDKRDLPDIQQQNEPKN